VTETLRPGIDSLVVPGEPVASRAERLAEAAGRLLADRRRRERMAAHALAGAKRFDATTRVAEVVELYRDVLVARRQRLATGEAPTTMP
jgi:hypothetical protein